MREGFEGQARGSFIDPILPRLAPEHGKLRLQKNIRLMPEHRKLRTKRKIRLAPEHRNTELRGKQGGVLLILFFLASHQNTENLEHREKYASHQNTENLELRGRYVSHQNTETQNTKENRGFERQGGFLLILFFLTWH